jgi:hypothetical protein
MTPNEIGGNDNHTNTNPFQGLNNKDLYIEPFSGFLGLVVFHPPILLGVNNI